MNERKSRTLGLDGMMMCRSKPCCWETSGHREKRKVLEVGRAMGKEHDGVGVSAVPHMLLIAISNMRQSLGRLIHHNEHHRLPLRACVGAVKAYSH